VNFERFFAELKRRNVYRVAVAYAVVSWLLIQIATQVFPFFEIPNWAVRSVVLVLLLGLPIALVLAWVYELTPEGLKRTDEVAPDESITRRTGRVLDFFVIGVLLLVIGVLVFQRFHSSQVTPAAPRPSQSIAVLPFENLSDEKANAFFADGVQEDVLTNLAKIHDLKVISRTSVMSYRDPAARNLREIAQALGVSNILEGSVRREPGKVRVTVALVDVRSDRQLWGESYDRNLADIFGIQSEIAEHIVAQLQAKLSPSEKAAIEKPPTTDLAAYELYLHAQALVAANTNPIATREKLPQAEHLLDEAVARDPHFLVGWCLLSKVHCNLYFSGYDHTPARLELAKRAVETALRLQPEAGEAHLAFADYYYHGFRDYGRARTELEIARRTLPNNAQVFEYTGYIERREGRWEQATHNLERSLQLDPRNFTTFQQIALTYDFQRRYADEIPIYDRALTIVPGDPVTRVLRAQVAFSWRADLKPVQTVFAELIAEDPSVAPDIDDVDLALCARDAATVARALTNYPREGSAFSGVNYPHAYYEGVAARWQGDAAKARAAFTAARDAVAKEPEFPAALSLLGLIDAGLGRKEEALREGRRACELLPISKDALSGTFLATNLAEIYLWTGEKDLALSQIALVVSVPNRYLPYGALKLHPTWDTLRSDPRFEKILAALAPKDNESRK
jgi:TolB-like protein/Flp pilus assembly protein TadD